jgi:hypothetical protein
MPSADPLAIAELAGEHGTELKTVLPPFTRGMM